jgi:hypothetical protein
MYGEDDPYPASRSHPAASRLTFALVLLAFVAGLASMAWVMTHWDLGLSSPPAGALPADNDAAALGNGGAAPVATSSPADAAPVTPEGLDARAAELEQRLTRISVAAQSASGYANRAEAIMVAFAARRTLDAGAPLGYLEGQLRLLFGEAQPRAVATIVNAASDPVTVNKLRAGIEDIHMLVETGPANESWWSAAMRTIGSLAEIRRAGAPAPEPEQRLARARRSVEAGQIEDAITQVTALPPQPAISQWLEQARRYNEAHRALDVIEAAAILEPRTAPMIAPAAEPSPEPTPAP